MSRNLKILITLFSLSTLYGAYYWGIPAVVDLPNKKDFIEQKVFEQTGYRINVENPTLKMGLIPSVQVFAKEFSILNSDGTKALTVQNPYINIRILPLILKNLDIHQFTSDNIEANLVFDKDYKLKLGQYLLEQPPQKLPLNLKHANAQILGYQINLDDRVQTKKIGLTGDFLTVKDLKAGKHVDFSTNAKLQAGTKKSDLSLDLDLNLPVTEIKEDQFELNGHIVNLDLSDFSMYAKSLSKGKIKTLSGIINFTANTFKTIDNHKRTKTNLHINNLEILSDDNAKSMRHKGLFSFNTDIKTIKNGISINEIRAKGNGISAYGFGKVNKTNSKIPNLDLKITINNSNAKDIISLLPGEESLCPDINLYLLKKTIFEGNVAGNLEIKGKADTPDIRGNILVYNAYMVRPIPNSDKATIKLSFLGDKLNLDVKVPTSPDQTVYVKGPINLYNDKSADLKITSTDNVDLKTAQIVLNPLHEILHFELGPVPIMDIKGKGGIDLRIVGTRLNPHAWGQFYFKDATVSFRYS